MSEEKTNSEAKEMKFDLEVAPIESITKAEVSQQIATAHQFPRSLQQFYKRAEAMVTMDEDTAASCLFKITRGGKAIEGESIRMAEIVASCYGNLRSAVQISGYTPTRVSVRAVCHDLETNNFIAVEKQAKTTYSDGRPYNEDMAIMIANATISKALRDAIFRVVPKALLKPLIEKAKLVAVGTAETLKIRRAKAMTWVTGLKIDKARVFAVLGVVGEEDIGLEQLETLTGLRTAIKEGDQTVEEAFPAPTKPVFEHPAKVQQEAEQKQAAATTAVEPEKRGPGRPRKIDGPLPAQPPPPVDQMGAMMNPPAAVAQPEPAAAPVAQPPAETDHTLAMPGLELPLEEPPAGPKAMTELQKQLQEHIEGTFKYTLEEFTGWAGKAIPYYKDPAHPLPKDWSEIPDDKCRFFITNIKGVDAGIKNWKLKKQ